MLRSQQTWAKANQEGWFNDEIAPVEVKTKKGPGLMTADEHPKPQVTMEALAKLPTVFKKGEGKLEKCFSRVTAFFNDLNRIFVGGVVTAGSASGICDGAGALIVASEAAVAKHNLKPLARIVGYGIAGCDPSIMGIGPVPSIRALLAKTGVKLEDIDEIEINEAFGAQTLACQKELGFPLEKLNTMGGAIALGHPLGASGARISAHLVHKIR